MRSLNKAWRLWRTLPAIGLAAVLAAVAPAQEPAADAPTVTLEGIVVEPAEPAADTLCKLKVKLRNRGTEIGSQLGFEVKINGQALPVYGNHLFLYPLEPGQETELQLYNFWSTETSRPMPADGKLKLDVTLTEARWFEVADDDEGVEVWTPIGPVEGLPSSQSVTLQMKK